MGVMGGAYDLASKCHVIEDACGQMGAGPSAAVVPDDRYSTLG